MFKGFYNLTSGMLTQQRNLNVVANNMVNISTAGYKSDQYTSSTFDEVLLSRVGNKEKDGAEVIGPSSYIRASSQVYTDYTQGVLEPTNIPLDFAIDGNGFFGIQMPNGQIGYTRMGSFSLDEQGYLCLPGQGRVLDSNRQPIRLNTDKIQADNHGRIYDAREGDLMAQVGVFRMQDTAQLERNERGLFVGAQGAAVANPVVHWRYLERSNVEMVDQMTQMLTAQRALQSAAQVTKMYDQLMSKATTDIGRL